MAFQTGNSTTLISKGSEIIGDIKFTGHLEIEGVVRGKIIASTDKGAKVRVAQGGCVEGDIHAPLIIVDGEVKGDVHSGEHVELAAKANVQGNVHYNLIEMVKGSQVNGNLVYAGAIKKVAKVEAVKSETQLAS